MKKKQRIQYKLDEIDKVELYQHFFEAMIDFGYTSYCIGVELAYVSRAIEQAENGD